MWYVSELLAFRQNDLLKCFLKLTSFSRHIFDNATHFVLAKVRRQPKPVKPKKMIRLENKFVVYAACNSGTSAVVTKNGEVYMFGKDTSHCDHASGEYATVMYSSVRLKHYFDAQAKHQ